MVLPATAGLVERLRESRVVVAATCAANFPPAHAVISGDALKNEHLLELWVERGAYPLDIGGRSDLIEPLEFLATDLEEFVFAGSDAVVA